MSANLTKKTHRIIKSNSKRILYFRLLVDFIFFHSTKTNELFWKTLLTAKGQGSNNPSLGFVPT